MRLGLSKHYSSMEYPVCTTTELILTVMATIAAIASAITACKAHTTASNALDFQKKLSKHQDSIFLLRSTISSLWQLKRIVEAPLAADDNEFESFDKIHRQIRRNLESLALEGAVQRLNSGFFADHSRAELAYEMQHAISAIDIEIQRLMAKINEIFS